MVSKPAKKAVRPTAGAREIVSRPRRAATTVSAALAWLEAHGSQRQIGEFGRYGITATRAFGVSVGETKAYAKQIGPDHALARALWASGRFEARLLAIFVDLPEQVTARQMDQWVKDFDNWALVDTACFHLFDRTPYAWKKVAEWADARPEFTKRTCFALLWSLTVHDKTATDASFRKGLELIEKAAHDERHFVKKAVNMALRAIGKRNAVLNAAAIETAERLANAQDPTPRWIGKHALRELAERRIRRNS